MAEPYRSPTMRLPVTVRCQRQQAPPWHDLWEITMDGASLVELSAELLSLPDPLPPRLRMIRFLTESVIARGLEDHPADWRQPDDRFYPGSPDWTPPEPTPEPRRLIAEHEHGITRLIDADTGLPLPRSRQRGED